METITLFNRSKRRKNSRDRHVNIEVASTEAVAGLTHENGMLVVPDVEALTLHTGDSIDPAITKTTKPIHRSIGSIVKILDDIGFEASDIFGAHNDNG